MSPNYLALNMPESELIIFFLKKKSVPSFACVISDSGAAIRPASGPRAVLDFTQPLPAISDLPVCTASSVSRCALCRPLPCTPRALVASRSLPASLPSDTWTPGICKYEHLGGASPPTDNRLQNNILCVTYMSAPPPF